jgi:hypothetical protein
VVEPTPAEDRARADAADIRADDADVRAGESAHRAEVAAARPGWYWWAIMVLVTVLASGSSIYVSRRNMDRTVAELRESQRRSEQVWCEVVIVIDDANKDSATPPATEVGQRVAAGIARVRSAYHC